MLRAETLPVRLGRDQPLQPGNERVVATEREPGIVEKLERAQPPLLELRRFGLVHRLAGEIGERVARPEIERAAEILGRVCSSSGGKSSRCRLDEPLEPAEVELLRLELQPVAGAVPLDALGSNGLAQAVHVHL